jgi:hypothetical protein
MCMSYSQGNTYIAESTAWVPALMTVEQVYSAPTMICAPHWLLHCRRPGARCCTTGSGPTLATLWAQSSWWAVGELLPLGSCCRAALGFGFRYLQRPRWSTAQILMCTKGVVVYAGNCSGCNRRLGWQPCPCHHGHREDEPPLCCGKL